MSTIAISTKNLTKEFQAGEECIPVLKDISVDIRQGELTMLVGPSGCGKTTLISILSGILSPTLGTVLVLNQDITKMKDTPRVLFRRSHIGFIFQQFNLLPALTSAENVAVPLLAAQVPFEVAVKKAEHLLSKIGMEAHCNKRPNQLSGGQQQRIAIARALIHDPEIIVCDEPTSSLDAKSGKEVMAILKEIAGSKTRAVLVVTHDNRIYSYADRILEMSDGKIIGDHHPDTFSHKE